MTKLYISREKKNIQSFQTWREGIIVILSFCLVPGTQEAPGSAWALSHQVTDPSQREVQSPAGSGHGDAAGAKEVRSGSESKGRGQGPGSHPPCLEFGQDTPLSGFTFFIHRMRMLAPTSEGVMRVVSPCDLQK